MLVLTRKLHQKIIIGENKDIIVEVKEIKSGQIKLGIKAPSSIHILRGELKKHEKNR